MMDDHGRKVQVGMAWGGVMRLSSPVQSFRLCVCSLLILIALRVCLFTQQGTGQRGGSSSIPSSPQGSRYLVSLVDQPMNQTDHSIFTVSHFRFTGNE